MFDAKLALDMGRPLRVTRSIYVTSVLVSVKQGEEYQFSISFM